MALRQSRLLEADKEREDSIGCSRSGRLGWLKALMPRIEVLILLVGLLCTVFGKLMVVRSYKPESVAAETAAVTFPDLLFFAIVALLIRCLYIIKPSVLCARCALLIAAIVAAWSVLNTGWLINSGVQLQPGILVLFARDFRNMLPLVTAHVLQDLVQFVLLVLGGIAVFAFFLWRFLRPGRVVPSRNHHERWALGLALVITAGLLARPSAQPDADSSFAAEVLNFSSHSYALLSTVAGQSHNKYPVEHSPNIYLSGRRQIGAPKCPTKDLPNVVIVLLESVSHSVTSLSPTAKQTTPFLARLASEGVEFRTTRVPMPYTSKAFWSTLTAVTPTSDVHDVEAVPADEPYEGLPSILARVGYRSAFFEMSKGNFECAPGFFNNLAFDWAWFRENLQDPSAHIGYLGGDDCRMIEPAIEWAGKNGRPFLLMMITSISHDPFEVPQWFEKPEEEEYDRYLQTIRYTDHFLEQLYSALHSNGLDGNTLLCIIGDHGTSFVTERAKGRWAPREEVIRVPWVMHWPGHLGPGKVVEWPCSQLDVTPTILRLIGFDISSAGFDGRDALAEPHSQRRLYFSSLVPGSPAGFVENGRKVVFWPYINKAFEYDLTTDPQENDPQTISADQIDQIRAQINRWESQSQIAVDAKKHTKRFLYSHWQIFSAGRLAWAYYVP
ncbi:MAG: sulfatase-like hydrolase/transferase [Sedimentisphaerales bacterium]|nr:sulfatase-like hydrolase/transferase [Sedimentisphaerales bacterium]